MDEDPATTARPELVEIDNILQLIVVLLAGGCLLL